MNISLWSETSAFQRLRRPRKIPRPHNPSSSSPSSKDAIHWIALLDPGHLQIAVEVSPSCIGLRLKQAALLPQAPQDDSFLVQEHLPNFSARRIVLGLVVTPLLSTGSGDRSDPTPGSKDKGSQPVLPIWDLYQTCDTESKPRPDFLCQISKQVFAWQGCPVNIQVRCYLQGSNNPQRPWDELSLSSALSSTPSLSRTSSQTFGKRLSNALFSRCPLPQLPASDGIPAGVQRLVSTLQLSLLHLHLHAPFPMLTLPSRPDPTNIARFLFLPSSGRSQR